MRLLAILEAYTITGPAKNLLEFARLARPEGVETLIATFRRDSADNLFLRTAREQGTPVEAIQEKGAWDPSVLQGLSAIADRFQPDIVQTHAVKSHFLARRARLPERIPWVGFHHGYTWPNLKARLYNQLDRWSLPAARKVLTVSQPFRDELVARGVAPDRIEIVHNAIPTGWGQGARGSRPDRPNILIVGRLSREKDHLTLLRAVHSIPSAHLTIVGEGPERPRIEAEIRRLNMKSRVVLEGQQSSAEPFYRDADVAVLSSLSEGSPNALLEAMSAQIPVVATRVGGIPEIVTNNESALLIEPRDTTAMTAAIARLLSDLPFAQSLVSRAAALIREHYQPQIRVRRLLGIYQGLLK